jgi:putative hydrolase of the HAD superfamily
MLWRKKKDLLINKVVAHFMMKKAILFDLDNTLYEYDRPHKKALKEVHKVLNKYVKIGLNEFLKLYEISKTEIHRELSGTASSHNRVLYFQRLIEKTKRTVDAEVILKLYNAYWSSLLKNMRLYKGVLHLFKELKRRNIKIGIVSDLTTHIQLKKLHKLGLSEYVDVLVTSEEAGREKPHPSMFLFALNKLGVLPSEVLAVGDNPKTDMEGANAVGIDTVLLMKGVHAKLPKEDYRKPNFVIKEVSELLDVLERIERRQHK